MFVILGMYLDWSALAFFCAAAGIPFALALWFIPESPFYLAKAGRLEEAQSTLKLLDLDSSTASILDTSNVESKGQKETEKKTERKFSDKLRKLSVTSHLSSSSAVRPFLFGLLLMVFFQGTAYPILIGTAVEMFREVMVSDKPMDFNISDSEVVGVDLSESSPEDSSHHLAAIALGVCIVLTSLLAVPLAQNLGRKLLLLISGSGISTCLFVLGFLYFLKDKETHDPNNGEGIAPHWILIVFLLYIAFFMVRKKEIEM